MQKMHLFFMAGLLCLLFSSRPVRAQFNQNFDSTAMVWDMVPCDNGDFVTLSGTGFRRYDFNGNLLWERYYSNLPQMFVNNNAFHACRLVHTDDDGVIYFGMTTPDPNPVAVKIDASGNIVWANEYLSSFHTGSYSLFTNFLKVDAKRKPNDSEEYIMVCSGSPALSTTAPYTQGNALQVLTIDGNGTMLWNKKYTETSGSTYYVKDLANTISFAGVDNTYGNVYYIAGSRVEYPFSGGENYRMFQLMIDESGNVVVPYQKLRICTYPMNINAIYDKAEDRVIASFTMGDCGITGGPEVSQIGLMKINRSLNRDFYYYYWLNRALENYGTGISKSLINGDYLICGWNYNQHIFDAFGDVTGAHNMTLLRTDVAGNPKFYKHYMVAEEARILTNMVSHTDASGTTENMVMASVTEPHGATNAQQARLVSADVTGTVCGSADFQVRQGHTDVIPDPLPYITESMNGTINLSLTEQPTSLLIDYCNYNHAYGYRPALGVADIKGNTAIKVYPTLLGATDKTIYLDLSALTENVAIALFSSDGRQVLKQSFGGKQHTEAEQVDVSGLHAGNYFLRIQSADKTVNATVKICHL